MDVLAELPGVKAVVLPGSLGMHEEYAETVADVVLQFFSDALGAS